MADLCCASEHCGGELLHLVLRANDQRRHLVTRLLLQLLDLPPGGCLGALLSRRAANELGADPCG